MHINLLNYNYEKIIIHIRSAIGAGLFSHGTGHSVPFRSKE